MARVKHKTKRGYFGIGVYNPKREVNIGTLWRSAFNFGASFIFTIGRRYQTQGSDTMKTPRHIPLYHYNSNDEFYENLPKGCMLVGVEQTDESRCLKDFAHPPRCVYILGAEDNGLSKKIIDKCHALVQINTPSCLNVAVAGSIVMYDRRCK